MKFISEKKVLSNDGTHIQQTVNDSLIAMAVAIIFLSCVALWAVIQLTQFYSNKVDGIDEQIHKIHIMRVAALERTLLMYAMVAEDDPFRRDEQQMEFYREAVKFASARTEFIKSDLSDNEKILLKNQGAITRNNYPIQEKIVDLVMSGKNALALTLLREQAIPEQNKVLKELDKIHMSIDKKNHLIKLKAESIGNASFVILLSIVVIIVFSVFYIIKKTTFRLNNIVSELSETRIAYQNTIHELIQQKDTLDNHAIVSITDEFGSISYVNEKFCEISGFSRQELIGSNHRMLKSNVHPDGFYEELWSTITQGKVWHGEVCNQRKDGSHYWVKSTISPFLDTTGKPYQYVSIRTNITELLEAKLEAEKANRAKSIFMSSMSHELRTPMNAILGFAQLLEMKMEGQELDFIKEIKGAGNHLLALINEILDLSNIETGEFQPMFEKIDINTFVNESILAVQDIANNKNIKINQIIEEGSVIYVIADRRRLKQALLNYLTNAVKFNHDNGDVLISIKLIDSSKCRILVKDSGPGLSKEQLSKIFNPFTKKDEHVGLTEGSGIGLTITKRIVEIMKGRVGVESEEGFGCTFWIELPIE